MTAVAASTPLLDTPAPGIMSAPVVACRQECFFEEVADILCDRQISGMPVVDSDDRVVGVVSERDLAYVFGGPLVRLSLRRPLHGGRPPVDVHWLPPESRRIKDIMTSPAVVATQDVSVRALAQLMATQQLNRVPIVGERGALVGVVTRGDVLRAIAGLTRQGPVSLPPIIVGSGSVGSGGLRAS